jgi:hypothetical protein
MYFSFYNILPVVWFSLAVAVIAIIYLLTIYRSRTKLRLPKSVNQADDGELPGVSVIVYANDNAAELREMLPEVLNQNYPAGKLEVIVVNDGSVDDITDVVNYLGQEYRNLYITFVPDQAHNLSRKKLAISLGIKAAKKEVVLLTNAECRPDSDNWLRDMTYPFTPTGGEHQVVLGWGRITGIKRSMLRFDQVARATTWLTSALHGHPYRGIGFNLAYHRELFFEAKGFSRSLNLHNGDDDIFINQIADRDNCAVVLTANAGMDVNFQRPADAYRELRLRHCFTERRLPKGSRRLMGSGTLALWLWVAAVAVGVTFSLPNWYPACIFAATIPLLWIPLTINWLRTGKALGLRLNPALLWWQMLWRWLPTMRCKMRCGSKKRRNFTWHTKKL